MREKPGMAVAHHLAEIGDLADLPQQADRPGIGGQLHHLGIAGQQLQGAVIIGVARLHETGRGWPLVEAFQQCPDRLKMQAGVAPR